MSKLENGAKQAIEYARSGRGPDGKWSAPTGEQIRALRNRLGLSQHQFAERFGLDVSSVRNWEQGRTIPEPASRQLFWLIDADPSAMTALILKASLQAADPA